VNCRKGRERATCEPGNLDIPHGEPSIKDNEVMTKRRGNPNWGKPGTPGPAILVPTSFKRAVEKFKLNPGTPNQYVRSAPLREWARKQEFEIQPMVLRIT
jgi:hypothetical protein